MPTIIRPALYLILLFFLCLPSLDVLAELNKMTTIPDKEAAPPPKTEQAVKPEAETAKPAPGEDQGLTAPPPPSPRDTARLEERNKTLALFPEDIKLGFDLAKGFQELNWGEKLDLITDPPLSDTPLKIYSRLSYYNATDDSPALAEIPLASLYLGFDRTNDSLAGIKAGFEDKYFLVLLRLLENSVGPPDSRRDAGAFTKAAWDDDELEIFLLTTGELQISAKKFSDLESR